MIQGKVWGTTEAIFALNNVEVHRIDIRSGGFSSRHRHAHKWNMFFIENGLLEITTWKANGVIDSTVLDRNETTAIPPGELHQFKALTNVVAYEIYWVSLNPDDILRESTGGCRKAPDPNAAPPSDCPS